MQAPSYSVRRNYPGRPTIVTDGFTGVLEAMEYAREWSIPFSCIYNDATDAPAFGDMSHGEVMGGLRAMFAPKR